uniref:Uncharacterized protein n=1 Tax=Thermosporothrix sp. COM3 TaxID=2490863 RepID=A0A455SQF2_9CHLR|nr:hypothetical protein KTC_31660 [Thermosporothrix sp. COM3]
MTTIRCYSEREPDAACWRAFIPLQGEREQAGFGTLYEFMANRKGGCSNPILASDLMQDI